MKSRKYIVSQGSVDDADPVGAGSPSMNHEQGDELQPDQAFKFKRFFEPIYLGEEGIEPEGAAIVKRGGAAKKGRKAKSVSLVLLPQFLESTMLESVLVQDPVDWKDVNSKKELLMNKQKASSVLLFEMIKYQPGFSSWLLHCYHEGREYGFAESHGEMYMITEYDPIFLLLANIHSKEFSLSMFQDFDDLFERGSLLADLATKERLQRICDIQEIDADCIVCRLSEEKVLMWLFVKLDRLMQRKYLSFHDAVEILGMYTAKHWLDQVQAKRNMVEGKTQSKTKAAGSTRSGAVATDLNSSNQDHVQIDFGSMYQSQAGAVLEMDNAKGDPRKKRPAVSQTASANTKKRPTDPNARKITDFFSKK